MNLSGPVALITAAAARNLDEDLPPLEAALVEAGADVQIVDWDAPGIDWAQYRIAVLRSAWDYTMRVTEFLAWADRVSTQTLLANSVDIVRWNTDKHYLAFLVGAGVSTVPSEFVEPGQNAEKAVAAFLGRHEEPEIVIKPAIGAGSRDAKRYSRSQRREMILHTARLTDAKRSVLLQPYLRRVDETGETAMIYIGGKFSHSICKGALLKPNSESTNALFAPEVIEPRTADADEERVGAQALAAIPFDELLYARVDLIRDEAGAPRVLELELTEPSLYFAHGAGSAQKLAAAILEWK